MEGPEGDEDSFEPGAFAVEFVEHVVLYLRLLELVRLLFGAKILGDKELKRRMFGRTKDSSQPESTRSVNDPMNAYSCAQNPLGQSQKTKSR